MGPSSRCCMRRPTPSGCTGRCYWGEPAGGAAPVTWGDFLAKAFSIDYEPDADYATLLDPPGAALSSALSLLFFGGGIGWPPSPAPESLRHLRDCAVESFLVIDALDVSTPLSMHKTRRSRIWHAGRRSSSRTPRTSMTCGNCNRRR